MHNSRTPASTGRRRPAASAILTAGVVALASFASFAACAETIRGFAASPTVGAAHLEQMLEGTAARFAPNDFGQKYKAARVKLAQSALVPSRIFDDTSVWDARPSASLRYLYVTGTPADGRYKLDSRPSLTPTTKPGDTRHSVMLEQLASNVFRWDTRVDFAIGSISAEEISNLISLLLCAPEGRTDAALREDYRTALPRAVAAFGKGFSIDSLHVAPGGQGATNVAITIGFHPELMKPTYPELAKYLDKYLGPAKYRFTLAEHGGAALMEIVGRDRAMTMRYRLSQGKLVSLTGTPRPWPDTLQLTADVSLKVKIFTVGFHDLVTDFVISNSGRDRAWTVVARREPDWDLPFITERLIRSPLRRPFEGQGSLLRVGVEDGESGAQTILSRHTRLDVQESAIMRFLGSLASHAVGDLDERVELEEHRFIHDGLSAFEADVRGVSGRGREER